MSQIRIGRESWHYQMYNWWKQKDHFDIKKKGSFHENLCHYMRVVLFWAPLGWFINHRVRGKMTPLLITIILAIVLFVGMFWAAYPELATVSFFLTLFIVAVIVCCLGIIKLFETYPKTLQKVFTIVFAPIWVPVYFLVKGLFYSIERWIHPLFFTKHKYVVVYWIAAILVGNILIALFFGLHALQTTWIILGIVIVAVAIAVVLMLSCFGLFHLIRYLNKSRKQSALYTSRESVHTTTLFRKFLDTKTGTKICPFILLPEESDSVSSFSIDEE